jgi:hypothetical protein
MLMAIIVAKKKERLQLQQLTKLPALHLKERS